MFLYKLDIIFVQEHNIKEEGKLEYVEKYCKVLIHYTRLLKGGIAIFIDNASNVDILNSENDTDGHIMNAYCRYSNVNIQLLNVYAPAGNGKKKEREKLFNTDILYFLRNNISNIIMGGDWNSIACMRDCSNSDNELLSKSFVSLKSNLKLIDPWFLCHHQVEYTYVRENYGSRLDRFYLKDLHNQVKDIQNIPVSWSDHCAIVLGLKLENVALKGKGYWKLNGSILDKDIVKDNFHTVWDKIKRNRSRFENILCWWEYAKDQHKRFFISCSKQINQEKYGLLNLLNYQLKEEIGRGVLNKDNFSVVDSLKLRINSIQDDICEGIKIRAKIEDKLKGEKVSAYLLGKEKNSKTYLNKIKRENGSEIVNPKAINLHIREYFEKLFKKEECNKSYQDLFLNLIDKVIDDKENEILTSEVTECEILKALQGMKNGKSPGIDGLTVEFYKTFWKEIKRDFVSLVKFVFEYKTISKMNKGIISLTPKEGDLDIITNWRPITMLNVDFKIVAKIITNRLKNVLNVIISSEQFCCVNDRSIINLNTLMRDIMFFTNDNDKEAALINLDWSKAFDRVDHDLLYTILGKFGFDSSFIQLIQMLYSEAESVLCINGNISDPFLIKKSVRQGCPLSKILSIIYQEPFYRMMKRKLTDMSLSLPNNVKVSVIGYADDSVIVVTSDKGIIECFNVISDYEKATGANLNRNKTSILGIGKWTNRSVWPINGIKLIRDSCKILGVFHSNNYQESISLNWNSVEDKINKMIGIFRNRKLSVFQKSIIINCKILAKSWYVSHVYPIPHDCAKRIQRSLCRYLWNGSCEPIARNTVFLPKTEGGLGLLSILHKSKAIMFKTFNKICMNKYYGFGIMYFYCKIKASFLMETEKDYTECSIFTTSYYSGMIDILRKVYCLKSYPAVSVKEVYWLIMDCKDYKKKKELLYPLFNWT